MATNLTLFHFEDGRKSFEDLGEPNGATYWREDDLRVALGYVSDTSFSKAITRAKQACLAVGIDIEDHFVRDPEGQHLLTRFACYLVAMNGDSRKPEVASAQAYFAAIAETFQNHLEAAVGIDRVLIREEIVDGQKSLASTASQHGLKNFAFFADKGYRGMYNMSLARLCEFKGTKKKEFINRMGKVEMAAHLFRITQTDEKIKKHDIRGQQRLEKTAFDVGQIVRKTMIDLSGTTPESLPVTENVRDVRKKLKGASKKLKALDNPKKKQAKKKPQQDD